MRKILSSLVVICIPTCMLQAESWQLVKHPEEVIVRAEVIKPSVNTLIQLRPKLTVVDHEISNETLAVVTSRENQLYNYHFDPRETDQVKETIDDVFYQSRGFNEVIGVGVSDFEGSAPTRMHNIKLALERFDGVVINQGETFSFNQTLGSLSYEDGFVDEGVILSGEFKKALGGGICQLSSTIFRAALNGGLPIDERKAHSYAFGMYYPHGLDATIYLGVQDFKFTNDTPGDVLLKTEIKGNKLVVLLYGTRDRQVTLARTTYWQAPTGALTTKWRREVKSLREQVVMEDKTIISNYKRVY